MDILPDIFCAYTAVLPAPKLPELEQSYDCVGGAFTEMEPSPSSDMPATTITEPPLLLTEPHLPWHGIQQSDPLQSVVPTPFAETTPLMVTTQA